MALLQCASCLNYIRTALGNDYIGLSLVQTIITSCSRIEDAQLQPLVRADDEDSPAGQRQSGGIALIRVHHSVLGGHGTGRVGDDRVRERVQPVVGLDVLDPSSVALGGVARQSDQLEAALLELGNELLDSAKLSCADRGVVGRVAFGKEAVID